MDSVIGTLEQAVFAIGHELVASFRWKGLRVGQGCQESFRHNHARRYIVLKLDLGGCREILSQLIHSPTAERI